jgi:hypothetical protein
VTTSPTPAQRTISAGRPVDHAIPDRPCLVVRRFASTKKRTAQSLCELTDGTLGQLGGSGQRGHGDHGASDYTRAIMKVGRTD